MTEKELRDALLGQHSTRLDAVDDARRLTRKVLERDGRRVRLLAALTLVLWAIAAAGILLVLYAFLAIHPERRNAARDAEPGRVAPAERERNEQIYWAVIEKTTAVVAISVAVLALAALGTVLLVLASRQATVRQVNAALLEISEELRRLKQDGPH